MRRSRPDFDNDAYTRLVARHNALQSERTALLNRKHGRRAQFEPGFHDVMSVLSSLEKDRIKNAKAVARSGGEDGRTVRVRLLDLPAIRGCRVLIVHNAEVEPVLRLLRTLPPSHGILTVSDEITFVNPEIVIALAQQEGRVVFGISPDAANKAGLVISSRLLRLARGGR